MMAAETFTLKARNIAIVGAGPSGVVAAKYLRAEKAFDRIVLFEQRSAAGGIWTYTGEQRHEDLFNIPQTDPRGQNQDPKWVEDAPSKGSTNNQNGNKNAVNGSSGIPSFLSPMYEKLEANIPRGLMGFQDLNWPTDSQLFPTHQTVLQYIEDYGNDVQDLVRYQTQVINLEPANDSRDSKWAICTRDLPTAKVHEEIFDAVIVANGHFITPYIPDVPGIREWNQRFPEALTHSKYYRRAEEYKGKKVIVVGNSASGADISAQIAQHCTLPLLWSSRSTSLFSATHGTGDPRRRELPPIKAFVLDKRAVEFENGSIEQNIDVVVFATGYFYSLPFLEKVWPKLITDGSHVEHTYKHLFYAPKPTLSFLVLNQRVIPFPVAEAQASVLARVYSGRLSLPSLQTMQSWEQETIAEHGNGRNFHLLPFPKDGNYINEMSQWARRAEPKAGLENHGQGKIPPMWGEWEFWCRENFPAIRRAFGALGEERKHVRLLEEVGFSFKDHQKQKAQSEGEMI